MTTSRGKALPILLLLLLVLAGAVFLLARSKRSASNSTTSLEPGGNVSPELVARFTALEAREKEAEETFWATEMIAQECGRVFENLWDSVNAATNKLDLLATFPVGELLLGRWKAPQTLAHGIQIHEPDGAGAKLTAPEWRRFVDGFGGEGWQLVQIEFRHNRFDPDPAGRPKQSRFYFSAHLTNPARDERAALEGNLQVDWTGDRNQDHLPLIQRIDASRLTLKTRPGQPPFREILNAEIEPPDKSYFIDPLILYDLDGDGLSEIILAAKNLVFRRAEGDRYEPGVLCRHSPGLILTGLIADFDGDAAPDFLCAKFDGLVLFRGSRRGTFDQPGEAVWSVDPHLKFAQVLTCGDIDRDGDLDVWLGQYKVPYDRGHLPTPYYDANDGHPAYLLLNDSRGNFTEATEAAGLGSKRWRRSYSASFADLDSDGDLDLAVVNDFAGIDLYVNDGRGRFTDVTRQWVADPYAAGMAHALADFDRDGHLDLLMMGMPSPTVDRLEHLGLTRPGQDSSFRARLMFGNRLLLARPEGGFRQTALNDSIARSGWSWGCGAFDFDNDGFPDVYIANGHESKQSVQDYEREFWLHDAFIANSRDDPLALAYFRSKFSRTRWQGQSFGGYEKNRFYLNRHGQSFVEIGHLLGVALEQDSRNVVADDLDGDGRVDLLVTTFEVWPQVKQVLHVYKNTLAAQGNWIGVRLREQGHGASPVGARVTARSGDQVWVRQLVTGDSYRSQHAPTVHFGLGNDDRVESLEVRWAAGRSAVLRGPEINRYHAISPTSGE